MDEYDISSLALVQLVQWRQPAGCILCHLHLQE